MDKSTHEENLSQPLQTNNKEVKMAVTFLTGYNGNFNVTNRNIKFYFGKSITDKDSFIRTTTAPGAYELESLNNENKRIIIEEGHFTEVDYPFTIKPKTASLSSISESSTQQPLFSFTPDDSIRDLFGFNAGTKYEEDILPSNPLDILSIDNIVLEIDIAQGMTFKGKRTGTIHNFTMHVGPG